MILGYQGGRLSFPEWLSENCKCSHQTHKSNALSVCFLCLRNYNTLYVYYSFNTFRKTSKIYSPIPSVNLPLKTGAQVRRSLCRVVNYNDLSHHPVTIYSFIPSIAFNSISYTPLCHPSNSIVFHVQIT
jgi:hypothetical protein